MAHDNYHFMMSMALDGILAPQENAQLHAHLKDCAACQGMWDRMCRADHLFTQPVSVTPPPDFAARVMGRVAEYEVARAESKPWRLALAIILGQFTAMAAIGLVMATLLGDGNIVNGVTQLIMQGRAVIASLGTAVALIETLVSALKSWFTYLVSQPLVWVVGITALTLASIWIGLLEVLKPTPSHAMAQSNT